MTHPRTEDRILYSLVSVLLVLALVEWRRIRAFEQSIESTSPSGSSAVPEWETIRALRAIGADDVDAIPMLMRAAQPREEWWPWLAPEQRAAIEAMSPRRRVASPEDLAGPIAFLLSEDSAHVTGTVVSVNGGAVMASY